LARKSNGTLWGWGRNTHGQLGNSTTIAQSSPIQIPGTSWCAMSTKFGHATGLKSDGTLWIWGHNNLGQLGQNNTINRNSPTQISGTWLDAAAGPDATWAIKNDGTVWACGGNAYGQQPFTGNKSSLVQVGSITTYTSFPIILSTAYGCIIKTGT
jgi:alpha-tubulin suppressor-like RCC1 family protein